MLTDEDIALILNDLIDVYGYDFTGYSKPMLNRRIRRLFKLRTFSGIAEFRFLMARNPEYLNWFINEFTVPVTEMFRDPAFFLALRKEIFPKLSALPLIRIWHAGCSTGEEVYSAAILLQELGLLHKSLLYATDINPQAIQTAATGIFMQNTMQLYAENYRKAGGIADFSTYYSANYDRVKFSEQLKRRIVFAVHNLVTDTSFNQFQLIICRNVLIYFNQELQSRVFSLFDASLEKNGFMALGSKETLQFTAMKAHYHRINLKEKIWLKQ